jgi:hypothetical protein
MRILAMLAFLPTLFMTTTPADAQSPFAIKYTWCSGSPDIQLSNVPKGTAEIEFKMVDTWVPSYNHGGGKVKYTNQKSVPCGAFSASYTGPSPPPPQIHDYELTAIAKDKDGKVLGSAKFTRKFPER